MREAFADAGRAYWRLMSELVPSAGACTAYVSLVRRRFVVAEEDEDAYAGQEEDGREAYDEADKAAKRPSYFRPTLLHVCALCMAKSGW